MVIPPFAPSAKNKSALFAKNGAPTAWWDRNAGKVGPPASAVRKDPLHYPRWSILRAQSATI